MMRKQTIFALITVAVTVVLCLAAIEIALRVYTHFTLIYDVEMTRYATDIKQQSPNPRIGHVNAPNSADRLMGVDVRINSDGFRDREFPVVRNASYRFIFLGDSLTFGWGVEESQTFKTILEAMLNKVRPTEVINFAAGNYNTEQEANLFIDKGLKYKPDGVVVFYFINDAEVTPRKSNWAFLASSRAAIFLWSRVNILLALFGFEPSFEEYYKGLYGDDLPGWIAEKAAFLQLRDLCARNGVTLRVVLLPELHVLKPYLFAAEHRKVLSFLHDNGVVALDLAPFFGQEDRPSRLWVAPDDAHPNAIAHALIAKYAFDFIAEAAAERKSAGSP